SFSSDSETADGYASPSDTAVADFLRPHMARSPLRKKSGSAASL
ncbi:MAG: hypothetical protein QOH86_73, partial [Sphingomonadales bacterium]|nr:hypothetical protein [Sphingomonadales bacterium]